jgi:hypothetical protein
VNSFYGTIPVSLVNSGQRFVYPGIRMIIHGLNRLIYQDSEDLRIS